LSRVVVEKGTIDVIADCGGGPNGAAIGPDGAAYICNNGGCFEFQEVMGMTFPGPPPASYPGHGSIQRVDLGTGAVTTLYETCDGNPLRAPNDIVFDTAGGFWFTDHGVRHDRASDRSGIYYAQPDGSSIAEVIFPLDAPNGIGLSPSGDRLGMERALARRDRGSEPARARRRRAPRGPARVPAVRLARGGRRRMGQHRHARQRGHHVDLA
jgi:gluconolactonase